MRLKIGFTYDARDDYPLAEGESQETIAEFDSEHTLQDVITALSTTGHDIKRIGNARRLINALTAGKETYDLIFNIAEGVSGRGREGQVPAILELFNLPYSGSDAVTMGITLDKSLTKKIVAADGVRTPRWMTVKKIEELSTFNLSFPVFVKPAFEGTSKGITAHSRVHDREALAVQVERLLSLYHQPVLVEEFISGSEFTVALMGNGSAEALSPVQVLIQGKKNLGDEYYTLDRVYNNDIAYICPDLDPSFDREIRGMAIAAYHALGCRDFGRIDFRVDDNGKPYFLECNPLPNIGRYDVFPVIAEKMGSDYNTIISNILQCALRRYQLAPTAG